jgi:hypothetical protein
MTEPPAPHMMSPPEAPPAGTGGVHQRRARLKRLQRPMPEVSGLSRRAGGRRRPSDCGVGWKTRRAAGSTSMCRRSSMQVTVACRAAGGGSVVGVGAGMALPPDQRPAVLLLAAGVVAVDGPHRAGSWVARAGCRPAYQMASRFWARRPAARTGLRRDTACAVLRPSSGRAGAVLGL